MEFEPLDEDLEEYLRSILDGADAGGAAMVDVFDVPEYWELKRQGYFADASEYMDCSASVRLSYGALRYFERKEKWEASRIASAAGDAGKSLGEKIVDKAVDAAVTFAARSAGM